MRLLSGLQRLFKDYDSFKKLGLATSIPFVMAAGPIVGYFIGRFLDMAFHTQPWLMLIFLSIGFVAGIKQTVSLIRQLRD